MLQILQKCVDKPFFICYTLFINGGQSNEKDIQLLSITAICNLPYDSLRIKNARNTNKNFYK